MNEDLLNILIKIDDLVFPAIIDTGAMCSIISSKLVNEYGFSSYVDHSQQGYAKGVGTSKIVGIIKDLPVCVIDSHCPTNNSRMTFVPVEVQVIEIDVTHLILGLDFLMAADASIKIRDRSVLICGKSYRFLSFAEMEFLNRPMKFSQYLYLSVAPLFRNVSSEKVKNLVRTVLGNIIKNPSELKYRTLLVSKLSNESRELLMGLGFEMKEENLVYRESNIEMFKEVISMV